MGLISVDLRARKQLYEQLVDNIKNLILMGELAPDEKLPSVRNLARELGINPNTIQKAYTELERQGVIVSLPGRGSVVTSETDSLRRRQWEKIRTALSGLAGEAYEMGMQKEEFTEMAASVWRGERKEASN